MGHEVHARPAFLSAAAEQHVTAGPYTPVVETRAGARIFVISGQAPVNRRGEVVGRTIEEQSRVTLDNCRAQLEAAGVSLRDGFTATVYLNDLAHWSAFNTAYLDSIHEPCPPRHAGTPGRVQTLP